MNESNILYEKPVFFLCCSKNTILIYFQTGVMVNITIYRTIQQLHVHVKVDFVKIYNPWITWEWCSIRRTNLLEQYCRQSNC